MSPLWLAPCLCEHSQLPNFTEIVTDAEVQAARHYRDERERQRRARMQDHYQYGPMRGLNDPDDTADDPPFTRRDNTAGPSGSGSALIAHEQQQQQQHNTGGSSSHATVRPLPAAAVAPAFEPKHAVRASVAPSSYAADPFYGPRSRDATVGVLQHGRDARAQSHLTSSSGTSAGHTTDGRGHVAANASSSDTSTGPLGEHVLDVQQQHQQQQR